MVGYPFSHQADMIFMYGKANGNSRLASRLYYESFPNRQQPTHSTFAAVFNRLHETGTLLPSTADRGVQRQRRTPDLEENILQRVEEDPGQFGEVLWYSCTAVGRASASPVKAGKGGTPVSRLARTSDT
ncbi:hypothetical protein J6590_079828 [Homalodisca vitripennis]|nr:hypothetical protein J6590_079828 [Homalodisca vitripennis]